MRREEPPFTIRDGQKKIMTVETGRSPSKMDNNILRPFKKNPLVNPSKTLDPQWGYGYMEGSQNPTRTPTPVYPTRDRAGFKTRDNH